MLTYLEIGINVLDNLQFHHHVQVVLEPEMGVRGEEEKAPAAF